MDEPRYIEVIGSALVTRPIDVHRGTVNITVTTRKTKTGHELALRLREQVIDALKSSGLTESQIEDSGGSVGHDWKSRKRLAHELRIKHEDMQVFANAMASVEQVFTNAKTGFLSGVSSDFSFTVDEPVYAKTEDLNEKALKDAVENATRKATLLAEAASVELGPVDQITELSLSSRARSPYGRDDDIDLGEHMGLCGFSSVGALMEYTPVSPKESTRMVQVRVRFRVIRT